MFLQFYLLGFILVTLAVQIILRDKEDNSFAIWAVSLTYSLIWPLAVPLDLLAFAFKKLVKRVPSKNLLVNRP